MSSLTSMNNIYSSQNLRMPPDFGINSASENLTLTLPDELLVHIISHLSTYKDLSSVQLTCKRWKQLIKKREVHLLMSLQIALNPYGLKKSFSINAQPINGLPGDSSLKKVIDAKEEIKKELLKKIELGNEVDIAFFKTLVKNHDSFWINAWTYLLSWDSTTELVELEMILEVLIENDYIELTLDIVKQVAKNLNLGRNDSEEARIRMLGHIAQKCIETWNGEEALSVAKLIPGTSKGGNYSLTRIAEKFIQNGYIIEALDIVKLISINSRGGISALGEIASKFIGKNCIKEAISVAKLIPINSDTGITLAALCFKLVDKGYTEEAREVMKWIEAT